MKIILAIIDHVLNLIRYLIYDIISLSVLLVTILVIVFTIQGILNPEFGLLNKYGLYDYIFPVFEFLYGTIPAWVEPLISANFNIWFLIVWIILITSLGFLIFFIPMIYLMLKLNSSQLAKKFKESAENVRPFLVKSPTLSQEYIINLAKLRPYRFAIYIVTSVYLYFGSLVPIKEFFVGI